MPSSQRGSEHQVQVTGEGGEAIALQKQADVQLMKVMDEDD
nr:hypothetical protein [Petrachloros mirabilis]